MKGCLGGDRSEWVNCNLSPFGVSLTIAVEHFERNFHNVEGVQSACTVPFWQHRRLVRLAVCLRQHEPIAAEYEALDGYFSLDLVTVPHPSIPNLAAIPTGPLPPNPADLLSSHKLADAITELRGKFKFTVIDSPPIMAATDAVILSVQVDGVLLVVRSGETPKEAFTRTRDLLISVKCRMLGVVLNAVDSSAPDYYYSYRYYPYSYGYGPQEAGDLPHFPESDIRKMRKSSQSDDDDLAL